MCLSLGFLFCSIDLYFSLCANTILSWWLWLCSIVWSQAGWFLQFHSSFSRLLWLFEVFCISIRIVKLFVLVLWIDHILGHKSSLGKFKKIEIIPVIFSDHSAVRLDLNYRKKIIKNSNIWRLNNMLLNNQQIIEEIKKEIKICIEMNENENTTTQILFILYALVCIC